jgi:GT2 family glycosyltransferase
VSADSQNSASRLSIAVVCYNTAREELVVLLESILKSIQHSGLQAEPGSVPVYLIDNSEHESLDVAIFADYENKASELGVKFTLLLGHGNIGYGSAHNLVLEKLESDYHLILNPDIELDENCLQAGLQFMDAHPETLMASPHARYADDEKQYLCKRYPSVLTFFLRGFLPHSIGRLFRRRLAFYEMRDLAEDAPTVGIPIVSGCFMFCRSAALKQLAGFDENYFLYFEDFDLSLRLGRLGKIAYEPAMRIRHAGGNAARKSGPHLRMFIRSGIRFFNTHGWRIFRQAS